MLTIKAVFSNAWAGTLFLKHNLPEALMVTAGEGFDFMISDGASLEFLSKSKVAWDGKLMDDTIQDILYDDARQKVLGPGRKIGGNF